MTEHDDRYPTPDTGSPTASRPHLHLVASAGPPEAQGADARARRDGALGRWERVLDLIAKALNEAELRAARFDADTAGSVGRRLETIAADMQRVARQLRSWEQVRIGRRARQQRVYFARAIDAGPILIGSSVDIAHGLKLHAYRNRTSLRLLGWLPGDRHDADALRARFASSRIADDRSGTWFDATTELIEYIEKETEHGEPEPRRPGRRRRTSRRIALD